MDTSTKERRKWGCYNHIENRMVENEKKVAEKACEVYAKLGAKAREAFVNQLEGMAFVLNSQKREDVTEEKKQEAS